MTNSNITSLVEEVCEIPYGLIIVAGPKKSGRTATMRLLETAVSKMNRGRYFRIGDTPPEDDSVVRFIETFKHSYDSLDGKTHEEVVFEFGRFQEWERKVKFGIFPMEPAGVFVDDLDQAPAQLSSIVVDMALVGILTIVSVEADSAAQAVRNFCGAARIDSGPNSLLSSALNSVILQKASVNPQNGDAGVEYEVFAADAEFLKSVWI